MNNAFFFANRHAWSFSGTPHSEPNARMAVDRRTVDCIVRIVSRIFDLYSDEACWSRRRGFLVTNLQDRPMDGALRPGKSRINRFLYPMTVAGWPTDFYNLYDVDSFLFMKRICDLMP